jgi:hypothetical protein
MKRCGLRLIGEARALMVDGKEGTFEAGASN